MSNAIGVLELRSISRGYFTTDKIFKIAPVEIQYVRSTCPGKILIIVSGDTQAVHEAIEAGQETADRFLVDKCIIHSVHPAIIHGLKNKYEQSVADSLGIVELNHIALGISALNKALKEADVQLVKLTLGQMIGGKIVFIITGGVSQIHQALTCSLEGIHSKYIVDSSEIHSPSMELKHLILNKKLGDSNYGYQ